MTDDKRTTPEPWEADWENNWDEFNQGNKGCKHFFSPTNGVKAYCMRRDSHNGRHMYAKDAMERVKEFMNHD